MSEEASSEAQVATTYPSRNPALIRQIIESVEAQPEQELAPEPATQAVDVPDAAPEARAKEEVADDSEQRQDAAPVEQEAVDRSKYWKDRMVELQEKRTRSDESKRLKALEDEAKANIEAKKLLDEDPAKYAIEYGGPDFADKWVKYSTEGKPDEDPRLAKVAELEEKQDRIEQMYRQAMLNEYIDNGYSEVRSLEHSDVIEEWFGGKDGVRQAISSTAEEWLRQTNETLTPQEIADKLFTDITESVTRLSKSEAVKQFLLKELGIDGQEPPKPDPVASAEATAPKTLTRDLNTRGVQSTEMSLLPPSERKDLIEQALRDHLT